MGRRIVITGLEEHPFHELRYHNARPGGGTAIERLPFLRGAIAGLCTEIDALVACSDLQGRVPSRSGEPALLGVAVAETLADLLPSPARTGVILAGDLYSVPDASKRGGYGDVTSVWRAFAQRFAWVAGVGGNHDDISGVAALGGNVHLLDGSVAAVGSLRIGGVGGIIGNPGKKARRAEDEQLAHVDRAIDAGLDVLVLHQGPHGADGQRGHDGLRATVEAGAVALTICGHVHWRSPLAHHDEGQILNVDARVVVLAD